MNQIKFTKNKHKLIMADKNQSNWADDEDYDSEEGEENFGLDANSKLND